MIDINTYRSRIGLFNPKSYEKKLLRKSEYYNKFCTDEDQAGKTTLSILQFIFKLFLLLGLLHPAIVQSESYLITSEQTCAGGLVLDSTTTMVHSGVLGGVWWSVAGTGWGGGRGEDFIQGGMHLTILEIVDHNFFARYQNGNIQRKKGILN